MNIFEVLTQTCLKLKNPLDTCCILLLLGDGKTKIVLLAAVRQK